MYMQGEVIHVMARTQSEKAKIVDTQVVMVELVQDFSNLVQTGYNRVPYDADTEDKTVWMKDLGGRVADGTITVTDNDGVATEGIELMNDNNVYGTGDNPCSEITERRLVAGDCTFTATEAGFKFNLHSRAMPVNVDSFGTKTLVATLEVTYEALDNGSVTQIGRRRRLQSASPNFDMRASTSFGAVAWRPASMPRGLGSSASMALEITLSSNVDRTNALSFSQAVHAAIVQSLNNGATETVYDSQVSVDQIFSNGVSIWTRPMQGQMSSRRLLNAAQRLRIEFTFARSDAANAMALADMLTEFDRQLRSPSSTLLNQPLLAGAVVHRVEEITTSDYVPQTRSTQLASSAMVPSALFAMLVALLW
jgi:hypothetical protein